MANVSMLALARPGISLSSVFAVFAHALGSPALPLRMADSTKAVAVNDETNILQCNTNTPMHVVQLPAAAALGFLTADCCSL
jgi:hypothetical protein